MSESLLDHQVEGIGGAAVCGDNHRVGRHDVGHTGRAGIETTIDYGARSVGNQTRHLVF